MRSVFFELGLEQLLLEIGDGLLVQNQYLGYVVIVCLLRSERFFPRTDDFQPYLFLEIFEHLDTLLLDEV